MGASAGHRAGQVLIDRGRIAERVSALGDEVVRGVNGPGAAAGELVLVPILTGALVFTADLIRHMRAMLSLRLVTVSSYPGATVASKGARIRGELPVDLGGKHVVVVDDILDTGQTLSVVAGLIRELGPASLRVCVLLRKPGSCRKTPFEAEHVGFEIPDAFVVGYGLDYDGYYRNLPDIAELEFVAGG